MKKLLLLLALSGVMVSLFTSSALATSHYCGYDGYYDDDYYYGYDYCGDSYYPSYFAASATATASPTATATASPTATATASPTATATASPTATATASALAATGGAPLVPALTLMASLALIGSGLGALMLVRRSASS
jgi:hypothetical protein